MLLAGLLAPSGSAMQANAAANNANVYYYTDYAGYETVEDSLIDNGIVDEAKLHTYSFEAGDSWSTVLFYYTANLFSVVEPNSYVIFDVREKMPMEYDEEFSDDNVTFADILLEVFTEWKNMGCKIMFISGTDEELFRNRNDFLDYVDIHVNTDVFTVFFANVLYRIEDELEEEGMDKLENVTFLLDYNLSDGIEEGYLSVGFFRDYLIPYIKYQNIEKVLQGVSIGDILYDNNIKVLCYLGNGEFFDAVSGGSIQTGNLDGSWDSSIVNHIDNPFIYAVGDTAPADTMLLEWLNRATDFREEHAIEFPIYICDDARSMFPAFNTPDVYSITPYGESHIHTIIEDFLLDRSLAQYDNWSGRCLITHKIIPQTPYGWFLDVFDTEYGYSAPFWPLYPIPEEWGVSEEELYYILYQYNNYEFHM